MTRKMSIQEDEVEFGNPVFSSTGDATEKEDTLFEIEDGDEAGEGVAVAFEEQEWGALSLQGIKDGQVDSFIVNWCRNACASKWLNLTILFCIMFNTAVLAAAGPANTLEHETLELLVVIDMALTIIFTIEMFIRIIALGFYARKKDSVPQYLNDDWNKLDFFVVISSWVNVIVEVTGIDIGLDMKTFRALRILRVLKAFKSIDGIRVILATIGASIPHSANVLAFLVFLFIVCGIVGVQMFRGATRKRCAYGGFDLMQHLESDRFPYADDAFADSDAAWASFAASMAVTSWNDSSFVGHAGSKLNQSLVWPRPPLRLTPMGLDEALAHGVELRTYEYPIGIGVWHTYCTVDEDCPLYDAPEPWNRSQTCQPALNPGKGFEHYDSAVDSWVALFINMACLYWWETAHRFKDADLNFVSANIAWFYGAFNVFILTMVTVNMFVAAVTTIFMDQRSADNPEGGGVSVNLESDTDNAVSKKQLRAENWTKPFYFVEAFGGDGPFEEKKKEKFVDRKGVINHPFFDQFILGFILINTGALAAEHFDRDACVVRQATELSQCQDPDFVDAMKIANYIFNFVFTVECVLKILGMGFKEYIRITFNQLDFFIVVTSLLDMIGELSRKDGEEAGGAGVFKLFRVFRLFRVLRVARILYRNQNLKRVLVTVFGSGEALANLVTFILFTILLFAVLGMHLLGGGYHPDETKGNCSVGGRSIVWQEFGDNSGTVWGQLVGDAVFDIRKEGAEIRYGYDVEQLIQKGLVPRRNFEDFPRAFLLAFQVMTGDDWVNQMHDYMEVRGGIATNLLFFANFAFCNFILLSLFIAVILENFAIAEAEKMELQKGQREQKIKKAEEQARRPKIFFVHRLVWLFGGVKAGKKPKTICAMGDDVSVDPDDGRLLPGESWYNDDKSLFAFGPGNPVRASCKKVAENSVFEVVVLAAIILGTVLLALEGAPSSLPPDTLDIFDHINNILFLVFLVEFGAKVVAYGFCFTPDSYIKNMWNRLDFIVIVGSIINYLGGNAGFVRLLRCMRPLRIINKNEGMKVIITAVIDSLAVNVGVLALSTLGLLIFSILGVSLFGGQMWSCNCSHSYPRGVTPSTSMFSSAGAGWVDVVRGMFNATKPRVVITEQDCIGEDLQGGLFGIDPSFPSSVSQCYWDNRPYNFDTTGNAMMSLFTLSTLAGWTDIMEAGVDKAGIGMQPVVFNSIGLAGFFLFYVLIMAFFVTNLFIGVLIDFISTQDGSALLTEDQQKMQDTMKYAQLHRPMLHVQAPNNFLRKWMFNLVESTFWNILSSSFIVFNVVVMMCEYEGQTPEWWDALTLLNTICLIFFTVEMFLKLIAYFPREYIADGWNKFDAFVISLSWGAIAAEASGAAAIRALRAMRIIVVLKSAKGIRSLFQTLMLSVAPGINISVLLLLLYSVYAILGMMLFGNSPVQDVECILGASAPPEYCQWGTADTVSIDRSGWFSDFARGRPGQMLMGLNRQYTHHASFNNFPSALKLLFQCATGQDWKFVMYAVAGEPGKDGISFSGAVYFMSFFFLSNYILLNLFVAVILDNFSASMRESELNVPENDFIEFKYAYRKKTTDEAPDLLMHKDLWSLMVEIGGSEIADEQGKMNTSAMSPPLMTHWPHDQEMAWALNVESGNEPSSVKGFLKKLYNTANSPLKLMHQPGISFGEFWQALVETPGDFESPHDADLDDAFPDRRRWDEYIVNGGTTGEKEHGSPSYHIIKTALMTLRFRLNFQRLERELQFHSCVYEGEGSEIKYDQVLQALVNVAMGEQALSLEEQLHRGVDSISGWKSDEAQAMAEILELEETLTVWQEKLEYSKMNGKGGSLGAKEIRDLELQVARIEAALTEKQEFTGTVTTNSDAQTVGSQVEDEELPDIHDGNVGDAWSAGSYRDFTGKITVQHSGKLQPGTPPKFVLVHLALRESGELPRLIMEVAGVPYKGVYYGQEAYNAARGSLPHGLVPALLDYDGKGGTLVRRNAVVRYLASQTGLAGDEDMRAKVDMAYETVEELRSDIQPTADKIASWKEELSLSNQNRGQSVDSMMAKAAMALRTFEAMLTASSGKYLTGEDLTVADLALWEILFDLAEEDLTEICFGGTSWDKAFADNLPRLVAFKSTLDRLEALQNYIKSDRRMPRTKSVGPGRENPFVYVKGLASAPPVNGNVKPAGEEDS